MFCHCQIWWICYLWYTYKTFYYYIEYYVCHQVVFISIIDFKILSKSKQTKKIIIITYIILRNIFKTKKSRKIKSTCLKLTLPYWKVQLFLSALLEWCQRPLWWLVRPNKGSTSVHLWTQTVWQLRIFPPRPCNTAEWQTLMLLVALTMLERVTLAAAASTATEMSNVDFMLGSSQHGNSFRAWVEHSWVTALNPSRL